MEMSNSLEIPVVTLGDKTYQYKLVSRFFYNVDFAKQNVIHLKPELFSEENIKVVVKLYVDYYNEHRTTPNIDNIKLKIDHSNMYTDIVKKQIISELIKMANYKQDVKKGNLSNDFEVIEKFFCDFIIIQKLKKESIVLEDALKRNDMAEVNNSLRRINDIKRITIKQDFGHDVFDDLEDVIKKKNVVKIPMGIPFIDKITGGLRKGDLILFLAAQGVGKSTLLNYVTSCLCEQGLNVLHIIFDENDREEVQNKIFAKWTGINYNDFEKRHEEVIQKVKEYKEKNKATLGAITIKQFQSHGMNEAVLEAFIENMEKERGVKFDAIVIDYLDEIESSYKSANAWDGEVYVAKAIKSLAKKLDVPIISAIQSKKEANHKRFLDKTDAGGSVAKIKKAQLIIGVGCSLEEQEQGLINFTIAKCNYARSGKQFESCSIDQGRMILSEGRIMDQELEDASDDDVIKKSGQIVTPELLKDEDEKVKTALDGLV